VTMPQDDGEPIQLPNAICLFERSIGDPAWRHYELVGLSGRNPKPPAGRPASELVVRSAAALGNYDYVVDYVFHQDGSIRIAVGATGVDATKGVASQSMKDATAAVDTRHGTLIAAGLVAPFPQPLFQLPPRSRRRRHRERFCARASDAKGATEGLAPAFAVCGHSGDAGDRAGGPAPASSPARLRCIISAITMSKARSAIIPATC